MLSLAKTVAKRSTRSFSTIEKDLPNIIDHAVGRQAAELKLAEEGIELFSRDPIFTEESQGNSKENPILVPSFNSHRAIGISHNDSPYIKWFNLHEGKVFYVPDYDKYFKLDNRNPNKGAAHHH